MQAGLEESAAQVVSVVPEEWEVQATVGSTIRNTVVEHPTATAQRRTGLGGRLVVTPWRIARPVRGNRSTGKGEALAIRADEMELGTAAVDRDWGIRAAVVGLVIEAEPAEPIA